MNHLQKYETIFESSSKTEEEIQRDIEDYFMEIIDSAGSDCTTTIELKGFLDIDFNDRAYAGHPRKGYNFMYSKTTEAKHKTYVFRLEINDKAVSYDKILKCYTKLEKDEEYFTFEFRAKTDQEIDEFFKLSGDIMVDFYVVERPKKQ